MKDVAIAPRMIHVPRLENGVLRPGRSAEGEGEGEGFAAKLTEALRSADAAQHEAEHQARELAAGRGDALSAVLAISEADLSLRFLTSMRNRALEAFNEIIRMPV
jgi:flagellar hook-basal body complex protein FliE